MFAILDRRNAAVALLGFAMSAFWITLYFREAHREDFEIPHGKPVGTVLSSISDVSRKPGTQFIWVPLPPERPIYESDTIRTGPDSQARIDLGGKGMIELKANSLAVIETTGDQIRINLASGDLFVKGNVQARVDGQNIRSSDRQGSFHVKKNAATEKVSIQTQGGSIKVTNDQTHEETLVNEHQVYERQAEKAPEITELPWMRVKPADGDLLELEGPKRPILFQLASATKSATSAGASPISRTPQGGLTLEVAFDSNFKKLVASKSIDDPTLPVEVPSPAREGAYYWRVRSSENRNRDLSGCGNFSIQFTPRMEWRSFVDTAHPLTLHLDSSGRSLEASWSSPQKTRSHKLRILKVSGIGETEIETLAIGPTSYFKTQALNSPHWKEIESTPLAANERLELEITALNETGAPIAKTALRAPLVLRDSRQLPAPTNLVAQIDKDPKNAILSWTHPTQDTAFEVKVGTRVVPQAASPLQVKADEIYTALSSPSHLATDLAIRALPKSGTGPSPSEWTPISIADLSLFAFDWVTHEKPILLYPPAQRVFSKRATRKIELSWKSEANAHYKPSGAKVEIQSIREHKSIFDQEVKNVSRVTVPVPAAGEYEWKVTLKWLGNIESPPSETRKFNVKGFALEAPVIREPSSSD